MTVTASDLFVTSIANPAVAAYPQTDIGEGKIVAFPFGGTKKVAQRPTAATATAIANVKGRTELWEDESGLIERAKSGDEAAFAAIYDRYEKPIYALIYRLMGNSEDAFDLTQDVFIKAFKAIGKTQPDLNLSAWLHRIASNACLDVLRRRKIVRWLPWDPEIHTNITPANESDEPERRVLRQEIKEQVQAVLNRMSEKYRLCLVLREYQDLSCEEIAEIMNLSRAAVKSTLFRAREQFRQIYEEMQSENWAALKNPDAKLSISGSRSAGKKGGRR